MFAVQLKNNQNQELKVDKLTLDLTHNGSVNLQFTTDYVGPCNILIFYNKVLVGDKTYQIITSSLGNFKNIYIYIILLLHI